MLMVCEISQRNLCVAQRLDAVSWVYMYINWRQISCPMNLNEQDINAAWILFCIRNSDFPTDPEECHHCGRKHTAHWRKGQGTDGTYIQLCNPCGLLYNKDRYYCGCKCIYRSKQLKRMQV